MWDGMTLVPGRDCGDCTVCCTVPRIDQPDIQKVSGATCRHRGDTGCAVYDTRPQVCRSFYCAWRTVEIFDDGWRPDLSGVFPQVETRGVPDAFGMDTGIDLMLVGNPLKTVRQRWFQDFVVTGVMNSIPVFISLPGPRGHQAATVSMNSEEMLEAIKRGAVKDALESVVKILRGWKFTPAVITHTGNDVSAP